MQYLISLLCWDRVQKQKQRRKLRQTRKIRRGIKLSLFIFGDCANIDYVKVITYQKGETKWQIKVKEKVLML